MNFESAWGITEEETFEFDRKKHERKLPLEDEESVTREKSLEEPKRYQKSDKSVKKSDEKSDNKKRTRASIPGSMFFRRSSKSKKVLRQKLEHTVSSLTMHDSQIAADLSSVDPAIHPISVRNDVEEAAFTELEEQVDVRDLMSLQA